MEIKYYFLVYEFKDEHMRDWQRSNAVLDKHPIVWLKDMIDNYQDEYRILFYDEIDKEQYDLINGWID